MKKFYLLSLLSLFVILVVSGSVFADNTGLIKEVLDSNIPESWYEAPELASEIGINKFNQSPMLDERVDNGSLPSVTERLPEDPPVIEPYDQVGKYGGTALEWNDQQDWDNSWHESEMAGFMGANNGELGRPTPDLNKRVPYLVKGWEYSPDYKEFTLFLRKGVKWSDGHPFTTDDYIYWWKHVANNEDLNPVPPERWQPPIMDVKQEDKYTVKFYLGKSYPYFHLSAVLGEAGRMTPKHYMKQFHPAFVDKEKLTKQTREAGFENWFEYYEYMNTVEHPDRKRPTVKNPYVIIEETENYKLWERNPYFPFIDTAGNQLPYIDKIMLQMANSREMQVAKIATGEITFGGRDVTAQHFPLLKSNEEKGNYTVHQFRVVDQLREVTINVAHKDPRIRKILGNKQFRQALSLGIDRDEVNQKIFFGQGIPRQAALLPGSKYSEPEFGEAYADYKPEQAKYLLDKMGMKDVDGDGWREGPDGKKFELRLNYWGTAFGPVGELLRKYWQDIGLKTQLKKIDISLCIQQAQAYEVQMTINWFMPQTDLKYPAEASIIPINRWPNNFVWPAYMDWFTSGGKEGIEPTEIVKELYDLAQIMKYSLDEEKRIAAGKKIAEIQAEYLWQIGIVDLLPQPVVVSNKLKNVVKKGFWGNATQLMGAYYPIQTYLEE